MAVTGDPNFAELIVRLSERFAADFDVRRMVVRSRWEALTSFIMLARSDIWYSIGGRSSGRLMTMCARLLGTRRVVHWTGSDILIAQRQPSVLREYDPRARHLVCAEQNRLELTRLGIDSTVAPIPPMHDVGTIAPLPDRFTVLAYVPASRPGFYGYAACEELGRAFGPEVAWIIVGGARPQFPAGVSVEYVSWTASMADVYARSTVLLRCIEHDGLSLSVLEALQAGRHVVWTQPFPHCNHASDVASARAALERLVAFHERGALRPNDEGARYARQKYSQEVLFRGIARAWVESAS